MKAVKVVLILAVAALMTLGFGSAAFALHSGGVGHCDACHTMHNSQGNAPINPAFSIGDAGNSQLLVGSDPSSACLTCHVRIYRSLSDGSTTAANTYTPGGDFYWVTVDTPANDRGGITGAAQHGHSVIAADFGIAMDDTVTTGPSDGTVNYPANQLGCNSCHDPHGKIANNANPLPIAASGSYGSHDSAAPAGAMLGNYRLLGGIGYDGGGLYGGGVIGISFTEPPPVAEAYHGSRGQWPAETDTNHVDYGSGMSEWCANCHSGFTADGATAHRHPASDDAHLNGHASAYNQYRATGDVSPTYTSADSYDRLVPFERGLTDPFAITLDSSSTVGPDSNSNVMCLTCHRAHATGWADALRWDPGEELIAHSAALGEAYGVHLYYGDDISTRYNEFQRSLCNRCHLQD
jgi:hypothetical protein